ncbi:MAG: type II toxin-antitoxin system HicA family toxin [Dehalococcoidia bacterium]
MSQREKLIERIRARPPEADFEDVRRLLELYGYEIKPGKHKHFAFRKPGYPTITVPTVSGRSVKRTYLDQICGMLGLDD